MISIHNLEFHVTHACNLSCQQCSHYSNLRLKGQTATPEQADEEYSKWSKRVDPGIFAILGGEPAINPRLVEHIELAGKHWPRANKMLVSNGLLLHRHPDLPEALVRNNFKLDVSQHGVDYGIQDVIDLLLRWRKEHPGLRTHIRHSQEFWMRQYWVDDGKPKPFNSPPRKAFKVCMQKYCTQLFQGHLWKCPALAYFSMMEKKTGIEEDQDWKLFRDYKALSPDCTEAELRKFFSRRPIPQCRLCPASQMRFHHPNPTVDHGIGE